MSSLDLMLMGVKNLWRRKTRTILTVLGVVIGTTAIVVMLSLGFGLQRARDEQIERMGGLTTIEVQKPWSYESRDGKPSENQVYLDDEAVTLFKGFEHVDGVLATKRTNIQLRIGKKQSWADVLAVDFEALRAFGYELETGEWPGDIQKNAMVAGAQTHMNFYDPMSRGGYMGEGEGEDIMGGNLKVFLNGDYYGDGKKKRPFKMDVTGVLVGKGGWEDNTSYMSFYAYEKLVEADQRKYGSGQRERKKPGTKEDKYDTIKVKVDKVDNVMPIQNQIKEMGYEAWSNAEWLEGEQNQALIIQGVLGGIGGVSLLIAAIGITNTMIMSIYERTREIGVMKVLGARLKDIKNLFLFEAALIGLFGGTIGLGLSVLVSKIINKVAGNMMGDFVSSGISYIPMYLMIAALIFATLIGIISGYYPARRAMKLSALKAISTN
ncbi:ABC transporter permease [Acidaminobacter sp. JC074]|uniref:ABC transporter permease n=1 Tax=Acidaminobacter sp. JC074 TaxID=2530199 RepID=UPI001F0DE765|nr:ABC transporter permease [Acidaminobacter sp. JC074]MCH4890586.1 ABC transporter permease [Acidaminobacter sp. JC074]